MGNFKVYRSQDGRDFVIADGGRVIVKSGATIAIEAGATVQGLSTSPGEASGGAVLTEARFEKLAINPLGGMSLSLYSSGSLAVAPLIASVGSQGSSIGCWGVEFPAAGEGSQCSMMYAVPVPMGYKLGTAMIPVLAYQFSTDDPPSGAEAHAYVNWGVEVYFAAVGHGNWAATEDESFTLDTGDIDVHGQQRSEIYGVTEFGSWAEGAVRVAAPAIVNPYLGAMAYIQVTRDYIAGEGADYTGGVVLVDFSLYYQVDAIGAKAWNSKE